MNEQLPKSLSKLSMSILFIFLSTDVCQRSIYRLWASKPFSVVLVHLSSSDFYNLLGISPAVYMCCKTVHYFLLRKLFANTDMYILW